METTFDILSTQVKENYYMACIWPVAEAEKTKRAEAALK